MAESASKLLEGVFAVKKPPNLSSAQVLRDLQTKFAPSQTFAPLLQEVRRVEEENGGRQGKRRKISRDNVFKMGHGGTLDPLATGVLIVGIGRGTKHLNDFLGCTKTYETVVLFGKSTDTYDVAGKIVSTAPHGQITRELVEEKLSLFRGKIKQVPPVYSALKIQGMKAYEYARSGKDLPRELESRDMEVNECILLDWLPGGQHDFRWPAVEADEEEKAVARKLTTTANTTKQPGLTDASTHNPKDKSIADEPAKAIATEQETRPTSIAELNKLPPSAKAALHTHEYALSETPADGPIARIRLTVSSGFYVRSFAYDLGIACGSLGTMAELQRTRQGGHTTEDPVPTDLMPCVTYQELEEGEQVWGPQLSKVLSKWMESTLDSGAVTQKHSRDDWRDNRGDRFRRGGSQRARGSDHRGKRKRSGDVQGYSLRNSSSPE